MRWIREHWSDIKGSAKWDWTRWLLDHAWAFIFPFMISAYHLTSRWYHGLPPARAAMIETVAFSVVAFFVLLIALAYLTPSPINLHRRINAYAARGNEIMNALKTGKHRAIADFEIWDEELREFVEHKLPKDARNKFNSDHAVLDKYNFVSAFQFMMGVPHHVSQYQPEVLAAIRKLHLSLCRIEVMRLEM